MSGPTAGARFTQTQPVQATAKGGLTGSASPYQLFIVPAGKTYRLRWASVSLVVSTSAAFADPGGAGAFATIQDSNGNIWADTECFVAGPSMVCANGEVRPCDSAILPAGTIVSLAVSGAALTDAGAFVRVGGGAVWIAA